MALTHLFIKNVAEDCNLVCSKKKLGLRWTDSPRNFVLKEEDLLTQAEKTSEHRVPPLHRGPLPCEWAGSLPVLWETRDR